MSRMRLPPISVTLNIQNNSENDIEDFYLNSFHVDQFHNVNGQLSWPAATGTDILDRLGYGEWCYMENGQHTQGEDRIHSFFVIDIPAGSGRTVTLGISVFAQDLEDSYIYFAPSGAGLDGSASDSVQFYDLKPWL